MTRLAQLVPALALVGVGLLHPRVARAEASRSSEAPLLVRVATSATDRHQQLVHERTRAIERLVRALPGVVDASAALTLDDITHAPLDRPLEPARVALVLGVRGSGPDDPTLRALVHSVVRDLASDGLTVSRHAVVEVARPTLTRVGPFEVDATSATLLRTVLALSLTGNALLALLLLRRARPNRPSRPFVDRRGRGGPHA